MAIFFYWQFAGRGESTDDRVTAMGANSKEDGVDWTQFGFPLALILGLGGMFYHFYRDEKQAFSLFTLFFMTGLAIIIYLNQDNPQPRERDYSYVGSFLAFSVWVGIGSSAILEKCLFYFKISTLATPFCLFYYWASTYVGSFRYAQGKFIESMTVVEILSLGI